MLARRASAASPESQLFGRLAAKSDRLREKRRRGIEESSPQDARHGVRDDRIEIAMPEAYRRFNLARVETPWAAVNPDFLCAACRSLTNGFTEGSGEGAPRAVGFQSRSIMGRQGFGTCIHQRQRPARQDEDDGKICRPDQPGKIPFQGQSPARKRSHFRAFSKRTKPADNARGTHTLLKCPRSDGRVRVAAGHAYHSKMIDPERMANSSTSRGQSCSVRPRIKSDSLTFPANRWQRLSSHPLPSPCTANPPQAVIWESMEVE